MRGSDRGDKGLTAMPIYANIKLTDILATAVVAQGANDERQKNRVTCFYYTHLGAGSSAFRCGAEFCPRERGALAADLSLFRSHILWLCQLRAVFNCVAHLCSGSSRCAIFVQGKPLAFGLHIGGRAGRFAYFLGSVALRNLLFHSARRLHQWHAFDNTVGLALAYCITILYT